MFEVISTTRDLQAFVDKISDATWVAIDTEFMREKTYFAKLCLIQIEAKGHRACIDPLKIDDLSLFAALMHNPDVTKVFHAAHQDLEILLNMTGKVPSPIFDTQIAASVLGIGDRLSYARLVEDMLGVHLAKTQSRTNWMKRPLAHAQLKYAIDDVRYLAQMYPLMIERLDAKGRRGWLDRDFAAAVDPQTYTVDLTQCWKKVKGHRGLKRPQLAILRELAAWRERRAEQSDIPRRWPLSDSVLLDMAKQQPGTLNALRDIRGMNLDNSRDAHNTLLKLIKKGQHTPEAEWPESSSATMPTPDQKLLIDLLMLVIDVQARAHDITGGAIATRKHIEGMVLAGETKLSDDWRGALVNDALAGVIAGELFVGRRGEQVVLIPA